MTLTAERPALWSAMPGWGIAADLTPLELRNARQLKVLRKAMAAGIAMLLLACAGGYYLAAQENFSASADLATVTDRTVELQAAGTDFADVIAIQRSIERLERAFDGALDEIKKHVDFDAFSVVDCNTLAKVQLGSGLVVLNSLLERGAQRG